MVWCTVFWIEIFFFVFLILFWIFGLKAWIEIHHILPKKYFDDYNFNAILGRHFWSNAGEICQDILFFCFLNSMTRLVPNMLKSLFFWKMIESTGLPLTSFDKTDRQTRIFIFFTDSGMLVSQSMYIFVHKVAMDVQVSFSLCLASTWQYLSLVSSVC